MLTIEEITILQIMYSEFQFLVTPQSNLNL